MKKVAGEGGQVLDVLMDEAALHLHHIVVSLLCILPIIKEEEVSCLGGVDEVDIQNRAVAALRLLVRKRREGA